VKRTGGIAEEGGSTLDLFYDRSSQFGVHTGNYVFEMSNIFNGLFIFVFACGRSGCIGR
jgi:hypothetical protein